MTRPRWPRAKLSSRELTEACLARIDERDGTHSHDGDPVDQRVGARLRGGRAGGGRRARTSGSRAGDAPLALRRPDRAEGPLRRRRQAADRVEPACSTRCPSATATPGRGSPPRGWCCSATCTRTSSPPAGRPTRSGTRGRSSARPAARAAAPARRSPRGRCPRRPAPTPPARCASPRPSAARRRSSRRAARSRSAASCRSRRRSTTRARWPAACGTASRCSRPWPACGRRRSAARSAAARSRRGSPPSTRTSPTASSGARAHCPGERVEPPPPAARLDVLGEFFDIVLTEMLVWHRRFDDRRDDYRYSNRGRLEHAERARDDRGGVRRRPEPARSRTRTPGATGSPSTGVDAIVEPTVPIVAPVRGPRLRRAVRRRRRDLADALLGLDGLPGRRAALGRRLPQRPARERLADRRAGRRTGTCSRRAPRCRPSLGRSSP